MSTLHEVIASVPQMTFGRIVPCARWRFTGTSSQVQTRIQLTTTTCVARVSNVPMNALMIMACNVAYRDENCDLEINTELECILE